MLVNLSRKDVQLGLFDDTPRGRFEKFHLKNPKIFEYFRKFAQQLRDMGYKRFSANAIIERVRWEISIKTKPVKDDFKINNNYAPYYSRLLVHLDPSFKDFFEFRKIKHI